MNIQTRLTRLLGIVGCVFALLTSQSTAQDTLIEIDLSVANQVTITATDAPSLLTISGSNVTGFYLENFFPVDGTGLSETLVVGDLTPAENTSDMTPNLFRSGAADPGLNIWSLTVGPTMDFVAGARAFVGSGTWTLDDDNYAEFLAATPTGDIYFPADAVDDIPDAVIIGGYIIIDGDTPCDNQVGDVNADGSVDLLDIAPFVDAVVSGAFVCEADLDASGDVDLLDVAPFVELVTGG